MSAEGNFPHCCTFVLANTRRYIQLKDLYTGRKTGAYWYHYGLHWRAYAAYIAGIIINIVGFVGAVTGKKVPAGATYIYNLNFFAGFLVSSVIYYILCRWVGNFAEFKSSGWWEVHDDLQGELTLGDNAEGRDLEYSRTTGSDAYSEDGKKKEQVAEV